MVRRPVPAELTDRDVAQLVSEIHDKLDGPVFNGGFERLVSAVQNMDKNLQEAVIEIKDLKRVVYEPDEGLFARVKRNDTELAGLTEWKTQMTSPKDGFVARTDKDHHSVEILMAWKMRIVAIGVSAVGATLLMVGKMVWDLIKSHVILH